VYGPGRVVGISSRKTLKVSTAGKGGTLDKVAAGVEMGSGTLGGIGSVGAITAAGPGGMIGSRSLFPGI